MYVFTDGSAVSNGYSNCKASWAVYFNTNDERNESGQVLIGPSNQKAELYAIKVALEKTKNENESIIIVTDSKYSIDCITKWSKAWEKNGWKTSKNEAVKHATLIKECREMVLAKEVKFLHINSHRVPPKDKGSIEWFLWNGNHQADRLAANVIHGECNKIDKGKVITIDWTGSLSLDEVKEQKKKKGTEKNEDSITINW